MVAAINDASLSKVEGFGKKASQPKREARSLTSSAALFVSHFFQIADLMKAVANDQIGAFGKPGIPASMAKQFRFLSIILSE